MKETQAAEIRRNAPCASRSAPRTAKPRRFMCTDPPRRVISLVSRKTVLIARRSARRSATVGAVLSALRERTRRVGRCGTVSGWIGEALRRSSHRVGRASRRSTTPMTKAVAAKEELEAGGAAAGPAPRLRREAEGSRPQGRAKASCLAGETCSWCVARARADPPALQMCFDRSQVRRGSPRRCRSRRPRSCPSCRCARALAGIPRAPTRRACTGAPSTSDRLTQWGNAIIQFYFRERQRKRDCIAHARFQPSEPLSTSGRTASGTTSSTRTTPSSRARACPRPPRRGSSAARASSPRST